MSKEAVAKTKMGKVPAIKKVEEPTTKKVEKPTTKENVKVEVVHLSAAEKNQLSEENLPLIHSVARRFSNFRVEHEEIFSVALVGFANALNTYNKNSKAKFTTYSVRCMINEIITTFRKENRYYDNKINMEHVIHRDKVGGALLVEDVVSAQSGDALNTEETFLLSEDLSLLTEMLDTLTPDEKEVITRRFGIGRKIETQDEIAESMNMSQANVSKIQKTAKSKLYVRLRGRINQTYDEGFSLN